MADLPSQPTTHTAPVLTARTGGGVKIVHPERADAALSPDIADTLARAMADLAKPGTSGGVLRSAMDASGGTTTIEPGNLLHAIKDMGKEGSDGSKGITREEFLQTFFLWGGLHFGLTIDDVITRYGLPSESSHTMVAYEHAHPKGPGLVLVQTPDDSKLINYVVVHGPGGIDFLSQHNVSDQRLALIGMHRDDILKLLGAPTQNVGELDDGRVCFGYMTVIGIEATSPAGETLRFGLMIYVMFYLANRNVPVCIAISTQWEPVMLEDLENVA